MFSFINSSSALLLVVLAVGCSADNSWDVELNRKDLALETNQNTGEGFDGDVLGDDGVIGIARNRFGQKENWKAEALGEDQVKAGNYRANKLNNRYNAFGSGGQNPHVDVNGQEVDIFEPSGTKHQAEYSNGFRKGATFQEAGSNQIHNAYKMGSNGYVQQAGSSGQYSISNIDSEYGRKTISSPARKNTGWDKLWRPTIPGETAQVQVSQNGDSTYSDSKNTYKTEGKQLTSDKVQTVVTQNGQRIYVSDAIKSQKKVTLNEPKTGKEVASMTLDNCQLDRCPDATDDEEEFDITNPEVTFPSSTDPQGNVRYEFPGCFTVKMDIQIPGRIDPKDVMAQIKIVVPSAGEMSCGEEYKCGNDECFYPNLCQKYGNQKVNKFDVLLDESSSNWCDQHVGTSAGPKIIPLTGTICPPKDVEDDQSDFFAQIAKTADIMVEAKIYERGPSFQCPQQGINGLIGTSVSHLFGTGSADKELIGCRKATCSYTAKYAGIPIQETGETIGQIGGQAGTELINIFGKNNKNGGGSGLFGTGGFNWNNWNQG